MFRSATTYRTAYCEYNISGLASDDFALIESISQEQAFEAELESEMFDAVTEDAAMVSSRSDGVDAVGGVAVSNTFKNETDGTIDLSVEILIFWDLVDNFTANQRGNVAAQRSILYQ